MELLVNKIIDREGSIAKSLFQGSERREGGIVSQVPSCLPAFLESVGSLGWLLQPPSHPQAWSHSGSAWSGVHSARPRCLPMPQQPADLGLVCSLAGQSYEFPATRAIRHRPKAGRTQLVWWLCIKGHRQRETLSGLNYGRRWERDMAILGKPDKTSVYSS